MTFCVCVVGCEKLGKVRKFVRNGWWSLVTFYAHGPGETADGWALVRTSIDDWEDYVRTLRIPTDNYKDEREREVIAPGIVNMNAFRCLRVVARPATSVSTLFRPSITRMATPQRYATLPIHIPIYTANISTAYPCPRNLALSPSSTPAAPCSPAHARPPHSQHQAPRRSWAPPAKLSIWPAKSRHTRAWATCRFVADRETRTIRRILCGSGDMGF